MPSKLPGSLDSDFRLERDQAFIQSVPKKQKPEPQDMFFRINIHIPLSVDVQINSTSILYTLRQAERLGVDQLLSP
jgi:hypothetical protein